MYAFFSSAVPLAVIGLLCVSAGAVAGFLVSAAPVRAGRYIETAFSGFTAGLLIAFICFKLLDRGFGASPFHIGLSGLMSGSFAAVFSDFAFSAWLNTSPRARIITPLNVIMRRLPEGLALGAIFAVSKTDGLQMAVIIPLHIIAEIIPETSAIFLTRKKELLSLISLCSLLALTMAAGVALGSYLAEISGFILSYLLTFSSGVMLYIVCGAIFPGESVRNGKRIAAFCAACGFILGVVITA